MNPDAVENKEGTSVSGQDEQQKLREYQSKKAGVGEYLEKQQTQVKKKTRPPMVAKMLSIAPMVIIGCFGLFFIPYIFYIILMAPDAIEYEEDGVTPIFAETTDKKAESR